MKFCWLNDSVVLLLGSWHFYILEALWTKMCNHLILRESRCENFVIIRVQSYFNHFHFSFVSVQPELCNNERILHHHDNYVAEKTWTMENEKRVRTWANSGRKVMKSSNILRLQWLFHHFSWHKWIIYDSRSYTKDFFTKNFFIHIYAESSTASNRPTSEALLYLTVQHFHSSVEHWLAFAGCLQECRVSFTFCK